MTCSYIVYYSIIL